MKQIKQWYVVYTKEGQEQKVCEALRRKKIDCFYPVSKMSKSFYGLEKVFYKPLLERYVFVYLSVDELDLIKRIDNILNFVYWLAEPITVSQDDIYLFKRFFTMQSDIHIEKTSVRITEPAVITTFFSDDDNDSVQFSFPVLGYVMSAKESKTKVRVISVQNQKTKTNSINQYAEAR